jgi:YVTN family beta-propeller protein
LLCADAVSAATAEDERYLINASLLAAVRRDRQFIPIAFVFALIAWLPLILMPGTAQAQTVSGTKGVGSSPEMVAVNPVTNKIYVANLGSNTVSVIDGATNNKTTVNVGSGPNSIAVNPATNKVYVVNAGNSTVTVIDAGNNNATTTVSAGGGAGA